MLNKVKPVYKTYKGWLTSTKTAKKTADLPKLARDYLKDIEKHVGVKISFVSMGPERDSLIPL